MPQERHVRSLCVSGVVLAHDRSRERCIGRGLVGVPHLRLLILQATRDPLVEEERGRTHHRVGVKALLPDAIDQRVGERHQCHPHVVRHVAAHNGERLAWRRTRIVERVVEAELTIRAELLKCAKVGEGALGVDHRRQPRRVRRNDVIAP